MWMSELSERSGLPVATIKFYLRDGLLPAGEALGATRSRYDEPHLRRLRLIRALVDVAGLRLETVRTILAAVDDESLPLHTVIGTAHVQLSSADSLPAPTGASRRRVDRLLCRLRWRVSADSAHRVALARALDSLASLDFAVSDELLDDYAAAMRPVAKREVSSVVSSAPEQATEKAVIGTVLLEPVLSIVRRMAQEDASSRMSRRGHR